MEYGYARVSTKEQNERRQFTALQEYGIENNRIYVDTIMQTITDMNWIFPENTGLYLLDTIPILPICINY